MDFQLETLVARALSAQVAAVDGSAGGPPRSSRYDELCVVPTLTKKYGTVSGGEYRVASMTPSGTALQLGLSASFSATAAAVVWQNTDNPANPLSKRMYLDFFRLVVGGAPTSATAWWGALFIDSKDRTPTTVVAEGGSAATQTCYTPPVVDPNMGNGSPSTVGKVYFPLSATAGAPPVVPAAGTAARRVAGNIFFRGQIPVVNDEYEIDFGSVDAIAGYTVTAAPAGYSRIVRPLPGVCLDPGQFALLYLWGPSNVTAGITFTAMDAGWWER